MKAHPYLIDNVKEGRGVRLEHLDPSGEDVRREMAPGSPHQVPRSASHRRDRADFPSPGRVGREIPVTTGRIDLLYVSTSGYPVIVETKLWRNPEAKREVVAQGLDMALAFPDGTSSIWRTGSGYAAKTSGKKRHVEGVNRKRSSVRSKWITAPFVTTWKEISNWEGSSSR
jgi:hypothetical protein